MKTGASPQWLNISELPRIAWMIDGMLETAEHVYIPLRAVRGQCQAIDIFTLNRIYEVYGGQLEDLWLYEEQLRRFKKAKTNAEQAREINRLTAQLMKLRTTLTNCLKLSDEISQETLDQIMASDDLQVGLEAVLGRRRPPF